MHQQTNETTGEYMEWFAHNLPPEYLKHPQYFLHQTALEMLEEEGRGKKEEMDTEENRRRFKIALTEHQLREEIPLPKVQQKDIDAFTNPANDTLRLSRAEQITSLTAKYLEQGIRLAEAQRMAVEELFHKESPLAVSLMDEAYFNNREIVERDLRAYVEQIDKDKTPLDLSISHVSKIALCSNGENVRFAVYLRRAGVAFGFGKNVTDKNVTGNAATILKYLFKVANYKIFAPMDKNYFTDGACVRGDLIGYARAFGKDKNPTDLTLGPKCGLNYILCSNGERVRMYVYIGRAGVELGLGERQNEVMNNKILNLLLQIAGYEVPEYMNEDYFGCPENIKRDLVAYAKELGEDKTPLDLNVSSKRMTITAKCSSGEAIAWRKYLTNAGIIFGFGKTAAECDKVLFEVLKFLLKIAGYETFDNMDEGYFTNPIFVESDLTAYARRFGDNKKFTDLTVNNARNISVICSNGAHVKWPTYLYKASRALGIMEGRKVKGIQTLINLKQIAAKAA